MSVIKELCVKAVLDNLSEGEIIDLKDYVERLKAFKFVSDHRGTYIVEKSGHFHYYYFDTLIKCAEEYLESDKYLGNKYIDNAMYRVDYSKGHNLVFTKVLPNEQGAK